MTKIYTMIKKITLLLGLTIGLISGANAQCNVTFTHTENALSISTNAVGTGTATVPIYGWDWGDGNIGTGQTANHTFAAAGTYTVCAVYIDLLDTASCNAEFCVDITVTASSASIDETVSNQITVKPNPFTNEIEVNANESINELTIVNTLGMVVYRKNTHDKTLTINTSDLPKGVYLVRFNGQIKRIVKG